MCVSKFKKLENTNLLLASSMSRQVQVNDLYEHKIDDRTSYQTFYKSVVIADWAYSYAS